MNTTLRMLEVNMYPNLEKEMIEKKITKISISKLLKLRYATILDKFSGKSRFFYDEAKKIKDEFFPEIEIEYLFNTDETKEGHH